MFCVCYSHVKCNLCLVFHDENALVQKNTSVIVRRIPGLKPGGILSHQEMAGKNERYAEKNAPETVNGAAAVEDHAQEMPKTIEGADEADRIASLISQSNNTSDLFPVPPPRGRFGNRGSYRGGRGGGRGGRGNRGGRLGFGGYPNSQGNGAPGQGGNMYPDRAPRPSANYVCHRCNQPGHWIDQCPTNGDPTYDKIKVRPPTGIPRSMLRQVDAPESGTGLQDSSGHFVTLQPNEEEFARQTVGLRLSRAAAVGKEGETAIGTDTKPAADCAANGPEAKQGSQPEGRAPPATTGKGNDSAEKTDGEARSMNPEPSDVGAQGQNAVGSVAKEVGSDGPGVSKGHGANPDVPSSNAFNAKGSHGHNRHVNRSNIQGRRGQNLPPGRMPPPGLPFPGAPPGFPPPPPFSGMPPPPPHMPPHVFYEMLANMRNGQGGMPPPGLLPNMPPPFGAAAGNPGMKQYPNDIPQQPGFPPFMGLGMVPNFGMPPKSGAGSQGEGVRSKAEPRDLNGKTVNAKDKDGEARPGPQASDSQGVSAVQEKGRLASKAPAGRGVERSSSEKIDSPQNSKSESRSGGEPDVIGERNDNSDRGSFQNDDSHDQPIRQSNGSRRHDPQSQSPGRWGPSPQRRLQRSDYSPPRGRSKASQGDLRRGTDSIPRERSNEGRGHRDFLRERRYAATSKHTQDRGNPQFREHSPSHERHYRGQRRRSPSPQPSRRGVARGTRESLLRGLSPPRYRRGNSGDRPRSPQRKWRERRSLSPREGSADRRPRFRSRTPSNAPRREPLRGESDIARARRRERPRDSRSPPRTGGENDRMRRIEFDPRGRRPRGEDRGDSKRMKIMTPDELDHREKPHESTKASASQGDHNQRFLESENLQKSDRRIRVGSQGRDPSPRNGLNKESGRDRAREPHRSRERERGRTLGKDKQDDIDLDRVVEKERVRTRDRDKEKIRDRDRGGERERIKEREKYRDRVRDRNRERNRDGEWERDRDRDWERERSRDRDRDRDRDSERDRRRGDGARRRKTSVEARPVKRSRLDRTPERADAPRREQKDRRSVHDRLGQPQDGPQSRRSVHDRLG